MPSDLQQVVRHDALNEAVQRHCLARCGLIHQPCQEAENGQGRAVISPDLPQRVDKTIHVPFSKKQTQSFLCPGLPEILQDPGHNYPHNYV